MPVPNSRRIASDFDSDEQALAFLRGNSPQDRGDERWAAVERLCSAMTMDERWAFLRQLDDAVLTRETLVWLGVYVMMLSIERDGMACEPGLRAGAVSANFRAMLACAITDEPEVREMMDSVLIDYGGDPLAR